MTSWKVFFLTNDVKNSFVFSSKGNLKYHFPQKLNFVVKIRSCFLRFKLPINDHWRSQRN